MRTIIYSLIVGILFGIAGTLIVQKATKHKPAEYDNSIRIGIYDRASKTLYEDVRTVYNIDRDSSGFMFRDPMFNETGLGERFIIRARLG